MKESVHASRRERSFLRWAAAALDQCQSAFRRRRRAWYSSTPRAPARAQGRAARPFVGAKVDWSPSALATLPLRRPLACQEPAAANRYAESARVAARPVGHDDRDHEAGTGIGVGELGRGT